MNFIHQHAYNASRNFSESAYYSTIQFENIKSVEMKKGDLLVKGPAASSFNLTDTVFIPVETENFEEIRKIVSEYVK